MGSVLLLLLPPPPPPALLVVLVPLVSLCMSGVRFVPYGTDRDVPLSSIAIGAVGVVCIAT